MRLKSYLLPRQIIYHFFSTNFIFFAYIFLKTLEGIVLVSGLIASVVLTSVLTIAVAEDEEKELSGTTTAADPLVENAVVPPPPPPPLASAASAFTAAADVVGIEDSRLPTLAVKKYRGLFIYTHKAAAVSLHFFII
jgi:hypothetical protein